MITLHVLAQSRALRIVWLLELIGAPYQIKTYARHLETLLAPDELKAVHPLGKSPLSTTTDSYSTKAARLPTT